MIAALSAIMGHYYATCRSIFPEDGIGFLLVRDAKYDLIRRTILLISQCIRFVLVFTGCWRRLWLERCLHNSRSFLLLDFNSIAGWGIA